MKTFEFKKQIVCVEDHLKHYAFRLTMNQDDAHDLFQDTVLKAISYGANLTHANFKAWIFTIMKNLFINAYRRKIRQREWMSQAINNNGGVFNVSSITPQSVQNYKEILQELDKLDSSVGVPFKMFVEGYKYKEIADEMNLPIGTIKSRIFVGRRILMGHLKDFVN